MLFEHSKIQFEKSDKKHVISTDFTNYTEETTIAGWY